MKKRTKTPRRPSSLRVGYTDIRIRVEDSEDNHGAYSSVKKTVTLATDSSTGPEGVNTLLHELLHAGYDLGSLRCTGLSADDAKADEERVVTVLANHLTELFRRNPRLVAWMTEELGK